MAGFFKKFGGLLVGALAGALFGGAGFSWGYMSIGSTLASFLLNRPPKGELTGAQVQKSAYGVPIPIVYGTMPSLASNIIDAPENGALEEVPWEQGAVKRSLTAAFLFCLGEENDGCGERRIEELYLNDILFFKRSGATNAEKFYLWREGNWFNSTPTFTYDAATGMEHFSGYQDEKGFWGLSNEWYITRGTRKQTPIPFLAALHDGVVPAYRDCVLFAVNRLILKPWQEGVPVAKAKIFNETTGLYEICTAHLVRGNCDADEMNLSALQTALVTGVTGAIQLSSEAPRQLVDSLAAWAFCDISESDGQIKASDRANPEFFPISREELAAYDADGDSDSPASLKLSIGAALDTPNLLRVRFYDTGVEGQVNEVTAHRQVGSVQNEQTLDMPLVASQEAAQKFVQMALDEFHAARTPLEITLPPSRLKCAPGDVLDIEDEEGNLSSYRIQEQTLGAPGLITCLATSWNGEVYDQPHSPAGVVRPEPVVPSYGVPVFTLVDTVALDDETVGSSGVVLLLAASAPATQSWGEIELSFNEAPNVVARITGRRA
ncbi:MAG TPA: phage tail protein, partial [Abditibacteriaceae bacterium]